MTVTIWSDIGCPWASLAVWRLHARRAALGLTDSVRFEHRCFPLELFNSRPSPRGILDAYL
jgi:predicted DsbA family dithiol-disulfide isomerase